MTESLESEPLRMLLGFDRWATDRIFETCRTLSDLDLDTKFPIGLGTLRTTLAHLVASMDWWIDHCQPRTIRPFNAQVDTLDNLYRRFVVAWDEITTILVDSDQSRLSEVIVDSFDNAEYGKGTLRYRRSAVLLHIFNHGTHHRVQCLNMFRHLGVQNLPEIDFIDSHQVLDRG